jgi:4'-phosphopantetheinyl transferase EntD
MVAMEASEGAKPTTQRLFGPDISVCVAHGPQVTQPHAHERSAMVGMHPRRAQEFAVGRACARRALAELGVRYAPLQRRSDGSPGWPEGFVGSLSHTEGLCVAVAASRATALGLGVDVEVAAALETGLARRVCSTEELTAFAQMPEAAGLYWTMMAFSAKEAVYKCHAAVTGAQLGLHDMKICFELDEPTSGTFSVTLSDRAQHWPPGALLNGRWIRSGGHVLTGVTLRTA